MLDKQHRTWNKTRETAPPTLASPLAGERRRGPHKLVTCTLGAYWSIGECIRARHLAEGVGYGSAIVKDLATDVGLAPRTLYEAIQFFDAYDEPPQHSPLTWTHHRRLLRLSSKKDRRFYERKLQGFSMTCVSLSPPRSPHEVKPRGAFGWGRSVLGPPCFLQRVPCHCNAL